MLFAWTDHHAGDPVPSRPPELPPAPEFMAPVTSIARTPTVRPSFIQSPSCAPSRRDCQISIAIVNNASIVTRPEANIACPRNPIERSTLCTIEDPMQNCCACSTMLEENIHDA